MKQIIKIIFKALLIKLSISFMLATKLLFINPKKLNQFILFYTAQPIFLFEKQTKSLKKKVIGKKNHANTPNNTAIKRKR